MNETDKKELVFYRISKSKETMLEIDILIANRLWNTAVNRLYYACYYAVSALLIQHDIKTQTHAGVRQMFGLHFVKTGLIDKDLGRFYSDIFDKRQTGDYDDFIDFGENDVENLKIPAQKLIRIIESIILPKLNADF
jgi:uncharacterized protein (UPF0332 family)